MQSEQGPASGCPVLCFGSVQLAKRLQSELSGSHVHHLQSSFLPQNLWQDSALSISSKLTEYSWGGGRRKSLNQVNSQIVQCMAKKLFPCCVNMRWKLCPRHTQLTRECIFSPWFMQPGKSFQALLYVCWNPPHIVQRRSIPISRKYSWFFHLYRQGRPVKFNK